jgi:cytochrome c oxidase assembly protein subunit 15
MTATPAWDLAPVHTLLSIGGAAALVPFAWVWWRLRTRTPWALLRALTWATLILTFDLVLFGAFTRLTDSGLGCPDWPGCYGHGSPIGAAVQIDVAQSAVPTGPVTATKAWIEMTHRYLAMAVGGLIVLLLVCAVVAARRGHGWRVAVAAALALAWVCLQGAFGALTVTMKLYPAIVTLHLLGGMGLLVLLAAQSQAFERRPLARGSRLETAAWVLAGLVVAQIALGGWVSTNYAVLACTDFPACQGHWWPSMDFAEGFSVRRELGSSAGGGWLPFPALTAIHVTHRLGALVVFVAIAAFAWRLARDGSAEGRRWAWRLAAAALWQLATGLSNVVLGWPIVAAVAHTGGAAALVVLLTVLLARMRQARRAPEPRGLPAPVSARAAS